ncbi:MAG: hypothetical protein E6G10_28375 [Actinobacteria bacterium]|nr:MAG: hypothetical protein E6G10_28375 [Actinomycetota bacterium]
MTFAQAQASVRIVIESLGVKLAPEPPDAPPAPPLGPPEAPAPPEAGAPPPPEPEAAAAAAPPPPAHRLRRPGVALTAAAIVAAAAIVVVALIAFQAGEQQKSPRKPRRAGAAPIGYGRKATLAGVSYQVDTARIGDRAAFQPPITSRRGTFVLVYLRVVNPTDRTLPLRFDALRLQTREGVVYEPTANLARFTLALTKNARQELPVPYDVPRSSVRGARLLVQRTSASGARRRSGLILDLALGDGLGELMPGTWRGRTSQGLPFSMRIEKGDVVRSVTVRGRSGRECTVRARGAAFVEGGLFRMHTGALSVDGRFSSSIDASGAVTSAGSQRCAFGTLRWRARTDLR